MRTGIVDAVRSACGGGARFVIGVLADGDRVVEASPGTDPGVPAYAASLAKPVTAACVAVLAQQGALDPDAPVGRYLPALRSWADEVRLTHLLHHCSALPTVPGSFDPLVDETWTSADAMGCLAGVERVSRPPGTSFEYNGLGYVLLSKVIEVVGGVTFAEFAQRHLFDPLGMSLSMFFSGPARQPSSAVPIDDGVAAPLSLGDGGLWTTVDDLLTWARAMIQDDLGLAGTLQTPFMLNDGNVSDYCWGIRRGRVNGHDTFSHGGSWPGISNKLAWSPEPAVAIAIMSARHDAEVLDLTNDLQQLLLQ